MLRSVFGDREHLCSPSGKRKAQSWDVRSSLYSSQDFTPVVDMVAGKVIHIDFPAHYTYVNKEEKEHRLSVATTAPPSLDVAALDRSNRERIPPPTGRFDIFPDLTAEDDRNFKLRDDLKLLHVIQPEGVSFKMNGNELEWQKWKMHVCEQLCLP